MKVALASDDGRNISSHFGRAEYYVVVEIHGGEILSRRLVPKENHYSLRSTKLRHRNGDDGHASEEQHHRMFTPIEDCDIVVARGMGTGALRHVQGLGLRPILTELATVDEVLRAYLDGSLQHRPERIHHHSH